MAYDIRWEKVPIGAIITEPGSSKNNKTGGWRSLRPVIDMNKCTQCLMCWISCPDNSIIADPETGKITGGIDTDFCKGCGVCASVCPVKAIEMVPEKK